MKEFLLILFTTVFVCSINAQETTKRKEVGILFSNLDNFGLSYKFGNSNSVWRINTSLISGENSNRNEGNFEIRQKSIGFSLMFGKEFRKTITEKLEFRFGADLSFDYENNETESNDDFSQNNNFLSKRITYSPGVNLVVGFNYLISESILLGIELLPGFNYITGTASETLPNNNEIKTDISGFNYNVSSSSALLTMAYRF